ncbi:hypothetical protein [Phormidium sp. CCY1219]|uniref:hypothetical protein n=1 Tax=Phormidium sp. CCY1219 TaxID=2886104 RepID=UPI002D1E77E9|nr:hypothetical protein [Phormidium sp. CCY1219]MEB3827013.1 hypothetical protein [Phormidium sp. CCY1219]
MATTTWAGKGGGGGSVKLGQIAEFYATQTAWEAGTGASKTCPSTRPGVGV